MRLDTLQVLLTHYSCNTLQVWLTHYRWDWHTAGDTWHTAGVTDTLQCGNTLQVGHYRCNILQVWPTHYRCDVIVWLACLSVSLLTSRRVLYFNLVQMRSVILCNKRICMVIIRWHVLQCWLMILESVDNAELGYRGGNPTAVQAWRTCRLWEPSPSHPILV